MTWQDLKPHLKRLQPPNPQWAIAELVVLILALVGISLSAMTPPPPVAHADSNPSGALVVPVTDERRTKLLSQFDGVRSKPSERVKILSEISQSIEDRGLVLQSRTLESAPIEYPPREVHRLKVTGSAAAQVGFLREMINSSHAIRIGDVVWSAGKSEANRELTLAIEFLTE